MRLEVEEKFLVEVIQWISEAELLKVTIIYLQRNFFMRYDEYNRNHSSIEIVFHFDDYNIIIRV